MRQVRSSLYAALGCLGLALSPAAFAQEAKPASAFAIFEKMPYVKLSDGKELLLDARIPKAEGPFPAVVIVHGGYWRSGDRTQLASYADALSNRGYATFCVDYRLAPGSRFPAQLLDLRNAVKWIRANAEKLRVDPSRIGVMGYSAGGHLAALLGASSSVPSAKDYRVQAVVVGGAPCDFRGVPGDNAALDYWLGGTRDEVPTYYLAASPIAYVSSDDPPTFIYHGAKDTNVKADTAKEFAEALRRAGVPVEFHEVPNAGHGEAANDSATMIKAFEFLDAQLHHTPPKPAEGGSANP